MKRAKTSLEKYFSIGQAPRPVRKRSFLRGFTLIETIMALTIFSFLAAGLMLCFVSGLKLWQRAQFIDPAQYDAVFSLEIIARDLRQSVDITAIPFNGTSTKVSFPTISGNSVLKITYDFDSLKGVLMRRQVDLKNIISGKENENFSEKEMVSLTDFSLSYLYIDKETEELTWVVTWEVEKGIPRAIKINAKTKNEEYNKLVFIPIS